MSEKISNITKGGVEEYKVLDEVYDANWRDDVPDGEENNVADFEIFDNESDYENDPIDDKPESAEKIAEFNKTIGIKAIKSINLLKKVA